MLTFRRFTGNNKSNSYICFFESLLFFPATSNINMAFTDRLHVVNISREDIPSSVYNAYEWMLRMKLLRYRQYEKHQPCHRGFSCARKIYFCGRYTCLDRGIYMSDCACQTCYSMLLEVFFRDLEVLDLYVFDC